MTNQAIVHDAFYKDLPVRVRPQGNIARILERNQQLLDAAIAMFGRALFVRMDIHFPEARRYSSDNNLIGLFMEEYVHDRIAAEHRVLYLWVWERDVSFNHHYHCCFCFDGNRTQSIYGHVAAAKRIWGRLVGVPPEAAPVWDCTVDRHGNPQQNGIMIERYGNNDYRAVYNQCYEWLSYLAKVDTKDLIPDGVRRFGSSQLASSYRTN